MEKIYRLVPILILIFVGSCGTFRATPKYPTKLSPEIEGAFGSAERLYYKGDYDSAATSYVHFLQNFGYNHLSDEARYKLGKIYFVKQQWARAVTEFLKLADMSPDREYRAKSYLMAGYSSYKADNFTEAYASLDKVYPDQLSLKLKLRYFSLLVYIGEKLGEPKEEIDYLILKVMDLYQESQDPSFREMIAFDLLSQAEAQRRMEAWVERPMTPQEIPHWARGYPDGVARSHLDFKLAKIYFDAGETTKAGQALSQFLQDNPKHALAAQAYAMISKLGIAVEPSTHEEAFSIGVLLPLSGERASYGKSTLNGIQCATGEAVACREALDKTLKEAPPVKLVVRDSGDTEASMLKAMEELGKVSAIIGPMGASLGEAAAKKAQGLNIPILVFTQKTDLMALGDYVFQMGYEAASQASDLVDIAQTRGIKKVGVFYPNNSYGQEMAHQFSEAATKADLKTVSKASYDGSKEELSEEARRLKMNVTHIGYNSQGSGFEAVFVPDSYAMLSRLVPTLQYVTIKDIPLMGTNAWNDPKLSYDLLQYFPGSFFVDLYFDGDANSLNRQFVQGFRTAYGVNPTSIEALGFDAVHFIRKAVARADSSQPRKIKEALLSESHLGGVTRILTFVENKGPRVRPHILTAGTTGIVPSP